uniref:Galactose oxidase-like Early set domain-containing protein n=1 Tax=Ditylum brightwellii TaxID=49249 RepID=A0A7S4VWZ1_9STRA
MGGDVRKPKRGFGINAVLEYEVKTETIHNHPMGNMQYTRWYATSINLPNGEIFVIGGADDGSNSENGKKNGSPFPEVYSPDTGFRVLTNAKVPNIANNPDETHWWYPYSYVNSKGDIIVMGPKGKNADIYRIRYEGKGSISRIGTKPFMAHSRTPCIMFRIDKVVCLDDKGNLWVADISDSSKVGWDKPNNIGQGRTNGSMAMLPDGRVAITGGNQSTKQAGNRLSTAEKSIQIWNPNTNNVVRGGEEKKARLYHSNLLVLPDATLVSSGGGAPGPEKNHNGQLYFPDYMSADTTRPIINDCPRNVESGNRFTMKVDDVSQIVQVTATKSGASSHSRNCDTRWIDLDFEIINDTTLRVKAEGNTIMIGGLWMVNLIDKNGVPSEAWLMGVDMAALP